MRDTDDLETKILAVAAPVQRKALGDDDEDEDDGNLPLAAKAWEQMVRLRAHEYTMHVARWRGRGNG